MDETPHDDLDDLDELYERFRNLLASGERRILGITGPPGSGKSTLAGQLVARFADRSIGVPMDGFHLANSELARLGRSERKGAEDTFDSAGFVALLRRLRHQSAGDVVYAPEFRREIEEPIAGAVAVRTEHRVIVTEGNYLLLERGHWSAVRELLDEVWYLDIERELRLRQLIARHVRYGRPERAARAWVAAIDDVNAEIVDATRGRADRVIRIPQIR